MPRPGKAFEKILLKEERMEYISANFGSVENTFETLGKTYGMEVPKP
jgi:hypothetical protein